MRKALFRPILPLLRALPPGAGLRVLDALGRARYALVPGLGSRFDRAVARHGADLDEGAEPSEIARALAGGLARWRARDLLLDRRDAGSVAPMFRVSGREHLDAALAAGKGVVLLGNHFGAHLLPAHWLLREGYALRLYMERPRSVSRFLARHFDDDGPLGQRGMFISRRRDPAEAARSILRAAKVLKAGMILQLAADVRWAGQHTAPARFLGEEYTFSTTWITLAAMTGAAVVPVFCRSGRGGPFELVFEPAYAIPAEGARDGRAAWWVQQALDRIADRVRADPASSNDYFFWTRDGVEAA